MNLYFDASILQVPNFTGCQIYAYNILNEMSSITTEHTFHLHFGMDCWNPHIDSLLSKQNVIAHVHSGYLGRHAAVGLNIMRTRSRVHYALNGNTGLLRMPMPCPTVALLHDMRFVLCADIYGADVCAKFIRSARKWMHARDCIITDSETVKHEIMSEFHLDPAKVVVAPCAPNRFDANQREERPPILPENIPFFLMVNLRDPRKNWDLVLSAFSIYIEDNPCDMQTVLVLAGALESQTHPILCKLQANPMLQQRTLLLGPVSDAQLLYLYRHARLSVYPSRYEGFGIPILEAMTHDLPTIVSDIPVFREVAEDGALYVPLNQPEALAYAFMQICNNKDLRSMLTERGRRRAEVYTWRKSAQITLDTLVALAKRV